MDKDLAKRVFDADIKTALNLVTSLEPKAAYDLIFEHSDPPALAREMSFEDAYLIVKSVGETDAVAFLEMMDADKIQGFFDLDCWFKDRLSKDKLIEWLNILDEFEDDRFLAQVLAMDSYLQVAMIKSFADVIKIEEPDENPFLDVEDAFITFDNRYAVKMKGSAEEKSRIYEFLMRIYRLDLDRFHWTLEAVYWETPMELEEYAYREKVGRLQERGFPEYYETLEVFSTVDPKRYEAGDKVISKEDEEDELIRASSYLVKFEFDDSLLRRGLTLMTKGMNQVQVELMTLINKICIANRLSFTDFSEVANSVKRADSFISLAIENKVGNDAYAAASMLEKKSLMDLYKIGRSMVIREGRSLRTLLPKICTDTISPDRVMFDSPMTEFIEGMLKRDPYFFNTAGQKQSISSLAVLADVKNRIRILFSVAKVMHDLFEFTPQKVRALTLIGTNQPNPMVITYTPLFCTCFANDMLGRPFAPAAVNDLDCLEIYNLLEEQGETLVVPQAARAKFHTWLDSQLDQVDDSVRQYFEDQFTEMAAQLITFAKAPYRDVRYISSLIVKIPY